MSINNQYNFTVISLNNNQGYQLSNDTWLDVIGSVLVKLRTYWLPYTPFLNTPSRFKWMFLHQSSWNSNFANVASYGQQLYTFNNHLWKLEKDFWSIRKLKTRDMLLHMSCQWIRALDVRAYHFFLNIDFCFLPYKSDIIMQFISMERQLYQLSDDIILM